MSAERISSEAADAVSPRARLPEGSAPRTICQRLAEVVGDRRIAVAESLTGGNIAAELSRAPHSSEWFMGGIVAYHEEVKHRLLDVPDGPVVSETSARQMARATAQLLGADLVVAVTGEAGPDGNEQPPGTVWFGIYDRGAVNAVERWFDGEPEGVLAATAITVLRVLFAHASCG